MRRPKKVLQAALSCLLIFALLPLGIAQAFGDDGIFEGQLTEQKNLYNNLPSLVQNSTAGVEIAELITAAEEQIANYNAAVGQQDALNDAVTAAQQELAKYLEGAVAQSRLFRSQDYTSNGNGGEYWEAMFAGLPADLRAVYHAAKDSEILRDLFYLTFATSFYDARADARLGLMNAQGQAATNQELIDGFLLSIPGLLVQLTGKITDASSSVLSITGDSAVEVRVGKSVDLDYLIADVPSEASLSWTAKSNDDSVIAKFASDNTGATGLNKLTVSGISASADAVSVVLSVVDDKKTSAIKDFSVAVTVLPDLADKTEVDNGAGIGNPNTLAANYTLATLPDQSVALEISDLTTPLTDLATKNIADPEVPMAMFDTDRWAVANIFLAVISLILVVVFAAGLVRDRLKNDWRNLNRHQQPENSSAFLRILGIVFGAASLSAVAITQNFSNQMVVIDAWSLLLMLFILVQAVLLLLVHQVSHASRFNSVRNTVYRSR